MTSPDPWLAAVRVETTVRQTFERECGARKRAVSFKSDREIDSDATWMFSDGGSKGWCGLVVLRPGQDARLVAREVRTDTRNVGAELGGLVSALDAAAPGERVVLVSDFLWSIYYVLGWYAVENPLLREQVAELIMRTFAIDVAKCDRCGARFKLRALVTLPASIERLLRRLGEPAQPLPLSPARGPPYFKSRAVRRKLGELDAPRGQVEMFGA